jgi:hypothetical protein
MNSSARPRPATSPPAGPPRGTYPDVDRFTPGIETRRTAHRSILSVEGSGTPDRIDDPAGMVWPFAWGKPSAAGGVPAGRLPGAYLAPVGCRGPPSGKTCAYPWPVGCFAPLPLVCPGPRRTPRGRASPARCLAYRPASSLPALSVASHGRGDGTEVPNSWRRWPLWPQTVQSMATILRHLGGVPEKSIPRTLGHHRFAALSGRSGVIAIKRVGL